MSKSFWLEFVESDRLSEDFDSIGSSFLNKYKELAGEFLKLRGNRA